MMTVRVATLLVLMATGQAIGAGAQAASSPQQFLELWGKSWDAHDVDAIMRLHAEDCVTVNRFGVVVSGKDANRRAVAWLHNGPFHTAHFETPKLIAERKLGPGLVEIQASWKNPSGRPAPAPAEDEMVLSVTLRDFGPEGWQAEEVDMHNVTETVQLTESAATRPARVDSLRE